MLEAVRRMVVTGGTMQIGGGHLFLYDVRHFMYPFGEQMANLIGVL